MTPDQIHIDPSSPHAAEAARARTTMQTAGVDPRVILQVVQLILAGLPQLAALIQKLHDHHPNPGPTPTPAPPAG